MEIDKSKLKDSMQRPLTQGLFLEIGYNTDFAIYTLKDEDFEYQGKMYPSLKRLYLEMEDPIEYDFANTYLLGWEQWSRICNNKLFTKQIDQWRLELELKLRSKGFREMMDKAGKSPMAAKWLTERGWSDKKAGRPSKSEIASQQAFEQRIQSDFAADIRRIGKTL